MVVGAKVMSHSGVVGRIVAIDDNLTIESAGSKIEVVKGAVRTVSAWDAPATEEAATEAEEPVVAAAAKAPAAKPATASAAKKPAAAKPAAAKTTTTRKPAAPKQSAE